MRSIVNPDQKYGILDYETRSEANLKKVGAWEYSTHPSTRILCAAWRIGTHAELKAGTAPVLSWSPALPHTHKNFGSLLRMLRDPSIILVAHNAYFEQVITRNVLAPQHMPSKLAELQSIPPSRWECTAAGAAALAIPRNLEGACAALRLSIQKDMDGRKLILKYCKPRRPTKKDPSKWHKKLVDLKRIVEYCENDIKAETPLFLRLPRLNPEERKTWIIDQEINLRGFAVDRELVKTVLKMIEQETRNLNDETFAMTGILSATQRDAVMRYLETQGVWLPDLRAKTVKDALEVELCDGDAKRLLEIRQAVSKSSTAKYVAFEARTRFDGRVRDHLVYHAAAPGRWGGAGVQPQNFPRGTIKDTGEAAEILKTGDLEWVRLLLGDPMSAFSSCLRAMIVPSPGYELVGADYNAIEVRVLFWIADHKKGLEAFYSGEDLYRHMAAEIFGIDVKDVTDAQRELGKRAILGCGYQMGHKKFFVTCKDQGQPVTEALAKAAVSAYRTTHAPVKDLWGAIERVAVKAVMSHKQGLKKKYRIHKTTWWVEHNTLFCELPSGRRNAYYGPEIKWEETPWGEPVAKLYHWGVDSITRKWVFGPTYGGKLVENIVQGTARDLMRDAILRSPEYGYNIVLSVHDELLGEQPKGKWPVERFENMMATLAPWATGCPVKAKGWIGMRYKK